MIYLDEKILNKLQFEEAALLSILIDKYIEYNRKKQLIMVDRKKWFYLTFAWINKHTNIKRGEYETARNSLVEKGYIYRKKMGRSNKNHYSINWKKIKNDFGLDYNYFEKIITTMKDITHKLKANDKGGFDYILDEKEQKQIEKQQKEFVQNSDKNKKDEKNKQNKNQNKGNYNSDKSNKSKFRLKDFFRKRQLSEYEIKEYTRQYINQGYVKIYETSHFILFIKKKDDIRLEIDDIRILSKNGYDYSQAENILRNVKAKNLSGFYNFREVGKINGKIKWDMDVPNNLRELKTVINKTYDSFKDNIETDLKHILKFVWLKATYYLTLQQISEKRIEKMIKYTKKHDYWRGKIVDFIEYLNILPKANMPVYARILAYID